jgi:hypothetical protein
MYSNADVIAAQDGTLALDAHDGNWLLKRWAAVWYRQGFDAFLQGKERDTLWANEQRKGWDHAHDEAEAAIAEKDAKPNLDATPWQVAEELTPEYSAWLDEFLPDVDETPEMAHWRELAAGAPIALSSTYVWADELADLGDAPGHDISTRPYLY